MGTIILFELAIIAGLALANGFFAASEQAFNLPMPQVSQAALRAKWR